MNTKQIVQIEVEKNGRLFVFNIPNGSSYGDSFDAAFEVIQEILKMSKEAVDQMQPKPVEPEIIS